jgi:hypothetical protein
MKESYEKLLVKLSHIQENNILIAKDSKRGKLEDSLNLVTGDEDYLLNLQDEVRKLHFQVK